jgi:hypothetical protein
MKIFKSIVTFSIVLFSLQSFAQNTKKDSCDINNFFIENESISINDQKSALGVYISFNLKEKKELASKGYVLLKLDNCKAEAQIVKIELNFDIKSGIWAGKLGIPQNQDCSLTFNSYEIILLNSCGDEYVTDLIELNKQRPSKVRSRVVKGKQTSGLKAAY